MSRLSKALILGALIGMVGLVAGLAPFGLDLEEKLGLDLLFKLRGKRQPPPEVMIVATDDKSAASLKLPKEPRKWPRTLHARLTENLAERGASVIAFDLGFEESKSNEEDHLFAQAIRKAGNVVLCEYLKEEKAPRSDRGELPPGSLTIQRIVPPIPPLAESAVALAPFPLPKVPVKVSQYWAFKAEAGDAPTLPVVVYQVFTLHLYREFIDLMGKVSPSRAAKLLRDKEAILETRSVENTIQNIRGAFEEERFLGKRMLKQLQKEAPSPADPKKIQVLKSLIQMYQNAKSPYLNFYGPPGTIPTIPYSEALQLEEGAVRRQVRFDFQGKAVFVGYFERFAPDQKDGFHTVFTDSSGLDLSGVEIAATAFANLLEGFPIQPLGVGAHLATLCVWGLAAGILCYLLSTSAAALSWAGLTVLYLAVSAYQFKTGGSWYPFVVPLLIESPLAFFGALVWKSIEMNKGRQSMRKSLRYYLPENVVNQLEKNVRDFGAGKQVVYGICLYTDAAQYTTLSETMEPDELGRFMDSYYGVIFKPIKEHGGVISGIVGDSVLALWVAEKKDLAFRNQACQAALDIAKGVDQFNQYSGKRKLPTRIGLHSGRILLGNIGAIDHYEYRAIGDIVNTASRIEGLNKILGTRILASEEVIRQLDGFLIRGVGEFLLVGKTKPLWVHELVCRAEESNEQQRNQCLRFAESLAAFRRQSWDEAMEKFQAAATISRTDGPCLFYWNLCKQYRENPPGESWDGVVRTAQK